MKQVLALHCLLQQGSVLQHQGLNLAEQVAILFLQVALQLAQQLKRHIKISCWSLGEPDYKGTLFNSGLGLTRHYLTLVCELGGGDVQLLKLLLELGEVGLQPGVLQLRLIQLALELLVIRCQQLIVFQKLVVRLVQPNRTKRCRVMFIRALGVHRCACEPAGA